MAATVDDGPASVAVHASEPADGSLVAALRSGDEVAFASVVTEWSPALLRTALGYVASRAVAEEVVQDTWLAVVVGLAGFEQRSSLKTWVFGILVNKARTRGVRERRTVPFAATGEDDGPTVDPDRFLPADHPRWPGHWYSPPDAWPDAPDQRVLSAEVRDVVDTALTALPERQRLVVTLRDVHGYDAAEVCDLLGVSQGNQRILLHRGRARVRQALETYYATAVGG